MSDSYFSNFNTIKYGNNSVIDITERVVVTENTQKNPFIYYPVDISDGDRADNVAFNNYQDPYKSWIVYLNNDIIDPYYEWYMNQDQFIEFIKTKYGSYELSVNKIRYFINNWVDQPEISISTFNALTPEQQLYWEPNYNITKIRSYSRVKQDWITTTNFILDLGITATSGNFIPDEIVDISYQPGSNGKAQVIQSNNTNLIVQHIFDDAFPHDSISIGSNSFVYGTESFSNCIITSCNFVANNIDQSVYVYWTPVNYYDYENEINEGNKTIKLIQPQYVSGFVSRTKGLLSV